MIIMLGLASAATSDGPNHQQRSPEVSSVIFGLLHGDRWIAGTCAGALHAAVLLRRGKLGDAVVAHAFTNALLAGWVVARGAWHLW
jgi:CAAX prenyl protease-like protein